MLPPRGITCRAMLLLLSAALLAPRRAARPTVRGQQLRSAPRHSLLGRRSNMAGHAAPEAATRHSLAAQHGPLLGPFCPSRAVPDRAPLPGMRAALQALLRGRAEGRLELIKGDEKQVRVVGTGARVVEAGERVAWKHACRGGRRVVGAVRGCLRNALRTGQAPRRGQTRRPFVE